MDIKEEFISNEDAVDEAAAAMSETRVLLDDIISCGTKHFQTAGKPVIAECLENSSEDCKLSEWYDETEQKISKEELWELWCFIATELRHIPSDLSSLQIQIEPDIQHFNSMYHDDYFGDMSDSFNEHLYETTVIKSEMDTGDDPFLRKIKKEDGSLPQDELSYDRHARSICYLCGKSVVTRGMKQHMKTHKIRHVNCNLCGKNFSSSRGLKTHIALLHEKTTQFTCTHCGKGFHNAGNMKKHEETVHEKRRDFSCPICDKQFTEKGAIARHISAIHEKQRPFSCEICGQTFTVKSHMYRHLRQTHARSPKHTAAKAPDADGEAPANVPKPVYYIDPKKDLQEQAEHSRQPYQRPYTPQVGEEFKEPCPECGVMIHRKSLERHINVMHRMIRDYKCEKCGKAFSTSTNLKEHLATHSSERPLNCHLCGRTFKSTSNYKKHQKQQHAEEWAKWTGGQRGGHNFFAEGQ